MATLILTTPGAISAPLPNHPKLPDLINDLYLDIDPASILGVSNGDQVPSIIATGSAPMADRTFAQLVPSVTARPLYSAAGGPGGTPCLSFEGSHGVSNDYNDASQNWIGAATYACVFRVRNYLQANDRVYASVSPSNVAYANATPVSAPQGISFIAFDGTPITITKATTSTDWQIGIFALPASPMAPGYILLDGVEQTVALPRGSYGGLSLGTVKTTGAAAVGTTLIGDIARLRLYRRQLTLAECRALLSVWRDFYSL
ncbi:hypothetical protein D2T31_00665 [Sinirhodobacter populi]|uniref:LamG domain-containing protein n=1 Tax=Paenirhodobacter populi TaxID=2306993 RepID=A0A443KIG0_9RHOB|nr:hypothetical protein [Sinirhodobacter populi]RWR32530.1 hypothetical protein D2T31_00665 [Sinirhodobacter populi]